MVNDTLLKIYHHLPARLRSVALTPRGLYLRSWRYGPETERLVEEALGREWWSGERWKAWQEERLAFVLHRAATYVPYYREQWRARRRKGDHASWEYLENWPLLEKEAVRRDPTAFVADDCDRSRMFPEHTSGSTGKPLDLWWSRDTVRAWYALFELRCRRWYGVSRYDHWAIVGGQPVVPARERKHFWVWNAPMRQLYLSANHINRQNAKAFIDALNKYGTSHIVAYSSAISTLAHAAFELGICTPAGLKVVITNGEPLFPWQRSTIHEAFQSDICQTYGMAEIVMGASECSYGTLHLWPELGWLEVLDDTENKPLGPGAAGRLVCTGLLNSDMPLVRYVVGDRGRMDVCSDKCRCGRTLPVISSIDGRVNDVLITPDGRLIFWLNPVFYGLPIREAQVIQETVNKVRVLYVPAQNFLPESERTIIERLRTRMGPVEVILEKVRTVPREQSGKFRALVCKLSTDQKNR